MITISTFIPFTAQQIHAAKHADLAFFLESRDEQLRRSGSELEWADHHVTIRGHTWFDQYESKGGTAINFAQKYFNANFQDAVQMLLGQNIAAAPVEPRQRERESFALPPKNENMRRVYAYLLKQRCIDRAVLDHFAHQKTIYESADYHNAVFVGADENGNPRHAHKRSTASQGSWRQNQAGSEAAYAFHHIGTSGAIYVFEAPIDMLSFISMYQKDWQRNSYVALCGVSDEALMHQLSAHENLREVVLCLDNDQAGHVATERISKSLTSKGYSVSALQSQSKDWAQDLQELSQQKVQAPCRLTLSYRTAQRSRVHSNAPGSVGGQTGRRGESMQATNRQKRKADC